MLAELNLFQRQFASFICILLYTLNDCKNVLTQGIIQRTETAETILKEFLFLCYYSFCSNYRNSIWKQTTCFAYVFI